MFSVEIPSATLLKYHLGVWGLCIVISSHPAIIHIIIMNCFLYCTFN